MNYSQFLEITLLVVTTITSGLSVLLYGTVKVLRETNTDYRERNLQLEEIRVSLEKRVNNLENEVSILRNIIGAKEAVEQMMEKLDIHHNKAVIFWQSLQSTLERLNDNDDRTVKVLEKDGVLLRRLVELLSEERGK